MIKLYEKQCDICRKLFQWSRLDDRPGYICDGCRPQGHKTWTECGDRIEYMEVPGGRIYRSWFNGTVAICFVPHQEIIHQHEPNVEMPKGYPE